MGLAAFNRMRQLEAMKPENIKKEAEEHKIENESVIETPNTNTESTEVENNTEKSTTRRRRRTE